MMTTGQDASPLQRVAHLSRERLLLILSTKPLADAYEELDKHLSALYREGALLRAAGQRMLPYINDNVPSDEYGQFVQGISENGEGR